MPRKGRSAMRLATALQDTHDQVNEFPLSCDCRVRDRTKQRGDGRDEANCLASNTVKMAGCGIHPTGETECKNSESDGCNSVSRRQRNKILKN